MNQSDFFRVVEVLLQVAHVEFDQGELLRFVEDCWPWIAADTDATLATCAEAFLAGRKVATGRTAVLA